MVHAIQVTDQTEWKPYCILISWSPFLSLPQCLAYDRTLGECDTNACHTYRAHLLKCNINTEYKQGVPALLRKVTSSLPWWTMPPIVSVWLTTEFEVSVPMHVNRFFLFPFHTWTQGIVIDLHVHVGDTRCILSIAIISGQRKRYQYCYNTIRIICRYMQYIVRQGLWFMCGYTI